MEVPRGTSSRAPSKLEQSVTNPTGTDDNRSKVRFKEEVQSQTFGKFVVQDISTLNRTIQEIRKDFGSVAAFLSLSAGERYKDVNGKIIVLGQTWQTYRQTFNTLVNQSRDQAAEAHAYLIRFYCVLLDPGNDSSTTDELKAEVAHFAKGLVKKSDAAADIRGSFNDLLDNLSTFHWNIHGTLAPSRIDKTAARELEKVDLEIKDLRGRLRMITDARSSEGAKWVSLLSDATAAAGTAILELSPTAMFYALECVIKAVQQDFDAMARYNSEKGIIHRIAELGEQRMKLVGSDQGPLDAILFRTSDGVGRIHKQIDAIGNIWQILKVDVDHLRRVLESTGDGRLPAKLFVSNYVSRTRPMFDRLSEVLENYARNVMVKDNE